MLSNFFGAIFIWIGLTEAVFCFDDNIGKVTITVELEMPGEKPRPLEGVVVYVPPMKRVHSELTKWLQENAKLPKPSVHTFVIKDKQLVPQFDIVYVGDSVDQRIGKYEVLNIEFFDNTPISGLDQKFLFREPEGWPISVKTIVANDCRPAKILVSDHTLHSITDKNGVVEFLNLPSMEKIPFRISAFSNDGKSQFQYSSSSLKMGPGGRFEVDTRVTVHEYTIRVVPKVSQK